MRTWWCFILLCFFSKSSIAQNWETNFDAALSLALQENKPLVLVFSGSDWCAPCIKLNKAIWESEEFRAYSEKNYVLYKADFPRKKKNKLKEELLNQNKVLAQRFNPKGYFPLVVVLDGEGKVLGKTGYQKIGPIRYIELLDSYYQ